MTSVKSMLLSHPRASDVPPEALAECVEACFLCAQACVACADACLAENDRDDLVRCIRLNLDCADACDAAGRMLARQTEPHAAVLGAQLEACLAACRACGEECRTHAHHAHCRECADACLRCEEACDRLLASATAWRAAAAARNP